MTKPKSKSLGIQPPIERRLSPDENLAGKLLWGNKIFGASFIARTEYLKKGSQGEKEARRALARLLNSGKPLHPRLQRWLGLLFDPQAPRRFHDGRMLEIVDREDGRRSRLDQLPQSPTPRIIFATDCQGLFQQPARALPQPRRPTQHIHPHCAS